MAEAFRWAEFRSVTKTATVSLLSNTYQVDPALTGRRVELVFDPFDMTDIAVNHHGKSFGKATPHDGTLNHGVRQRSPDLREGERFQFNDVRPPSERFRNAFHQGKLL